MIDGKHWPIPKKKLIDGSSLSIKNSNKLLDLANEQFKKNEPEYGIAIYLAVIAMEELGKAILLSELSEDSAPAIDKDVWNKNFEHHKPKIKAAVDHIKKFIEMDDPRRSEKLANLKELERFSLEIINEKLATLYVDWNAERNDWDFYDEKPRSKRISKAQLILKHANWLIENYTKSVPERTSVVIEMIRMGLVYGQCGICNLRLNTLDSVKQHHNDFPQHRIGFKEDKPRTNHRIRF